MAEKRLFGTDGVRGRANAAPLDCETVVKICRAAARHFGQPGRPVVIGRDTRLSGGMLEAAAAAGAASAGFDAVILGVLPTPGVAFAVKDLGASCGIVISASHNPWQDNGVKLFDGAGVKLSDQVEDQVEALMADESELPARTGRVASAADAASRYAAFLAGLLPEGFSLKGFRVVLDCGHGAAFAVAPRVFENLGAEVMALGVNPDGVNINEGCGSQHTERLMDTVRERHAHAGFAFDGDADRCICVDETGRRISGDGMLAILAGHMRKAGRLSNDTVVSTVMSNLGLKRALSKMGIRHVTADVGDRYVLSAMTETGASLGGEDSGHMIFLDRHTTGDGILTALSVCAAVKDAQKPLSELSAFLEIFPQILINVPVKSQVPLESLTVVNAAISAVEERLGSSGRVLVRYSGTRPVLRVMVEGPTQAETRKAADEIAEAVKAELG